MFGLWKKQEVTMQQTQTANNVKLFALKDKKLDTYGVTVEAPSSEDWKKSYITLIRKKEHETNPIVAHAQDFDLYELGTVNKDSGKVIGHDSPIHCFCLEDLKKS